MLNNHSYYSLRYGTISPEQLVEVAVAYGFKMVVLTDIHRVSGIYDFLQACHLHGVKPVLGMEFRQGDDLHFICLAKNPRGLEKINAFASAYLLANEAWPIRPPLWEDVWTIFPLKRRKEILKLGSQERWGINASDRNFLWKEANKKDFVWCQAATFIDKKGFSMHRLLRAIDKNVLLSKLPLTAQAKEYERWYRSNELADFCADFPELLEEAERILETCSFSFEFHVSKNRKLFGSSQEDDRDLLRKLALEGMNYRYPRSDKQAKERVLKELKVIHELQFDAYFLITWDIIRYARSRGYFHVGRGSGANSIVAYCLGITDVDPIELDLYFERFINPHRTSPPDFDIDFSWDERNEIIDYIFKRYGAKHVCLLATYVTFRDKSIYRELAKVFGLPKAEVDAWLEPDSLIRREGGDQLHRLIVKYGHLLLDFPNYLSIHAGGILISDETLSHYTALEPMPKGFPICQFDMHVAEAIGFAKFDILSQRGLGHIKEAVDIIRKNRGVDVDIHRVQDFMRDENIRLQLEMHETMGCFYIESPAMRQLIKKLNCNNYLTLVAASSIIRPGVASSGMMKTYIERHHAPDSYEPVHPLMGELMSETYGVMVYQEDVIKVAHYFAGLSLAEADVLRRGMSGKSRSKNEFERIKEAFFTNCAEKGYELAVAKEVWRQMESFSGYSFSKAHSASYAVESYQSLYLKTYFPREFMVAVINNFGGFYRTEFYVHEARRSGAWVEAPEINESDFNTRIDGETVYLGWVHVKGLEKRVISDLLLNREQGGLFRSWDDFARRVSVGLEQAMILIRVGAFRNLGVAKKPLLWEAHARFHGKAPQVVSMEMFADETADIGVLPELLHDPLEDAFDQWELLGFPLCDPFLLVNDVPNVTLNARLIADKGSVLGYLVTLKPTRTKNGDRMYFGYFLDQQGEFFDTVHFPSDLKKYSFQGSGVYLMEGMVMEEHGHRSLRVTMMRKLAWKVDPRYMG
jgi:DNA polymerase-3 subunit alpha